MLLLGGSLEPRDVPDDEMPPAGPSRSDGDTVRTDEAGHTAEVADDRPPESALIRPGRPDPENALFFVLGVLVALFVLVRLYLLFA